MYTLEILLVYLLSTLVFYLIVHVWKFRRYYWLGLQLPGPSFFMNIRYAISFITTKEMFAKNFIKFYEMESSKDEKPIISIWYGSKRFAILKNPDLIQKALKNNLQKDSWYDLVNILFTTKGLLTHDKIPVWEAHRKIISRASFNFRSIKLYTEIFFEEANILADKMQNFAITGEAFEPEQMLTAASFSMVVRTMCGLDMKIQQNILKDHNLRSVIDATETSFTHVAERVMKPYHISNMYLTLFGKKKRDVVSICELARSFINEIVMEVKSNMNNNNTTQKSLEPPDINYFPDETKLMQNFVEVILERQMDPTTPPELVMSHNELLDEISTVFIGGLDTTKIANTIILIMLALHPTIQQSAYDEIQTVLGEDPNTVPTYDQLHQLHILTRVIKESLRLFPSAPIIGRHADRDVQFEGYTIPQGASLIVFILGLHRDPRYWSNPNQFNPDRFLPSEVTKHHPNAYLPFSTGKRNCIGYKYAMLQMKTTISTILRRYRVLPGTKCNSVEDIRYAFGVTTALLEGNDIRLEPRSKLT